MVNIQASPGLTHASGLALANNYPEALRYPLEDAGQSQIILMRYRIHIALPKPKASMALGADGRTTGRRLRQAS